MSGLKTVFYEDKSLIVVWKPVGIESQSARGLNPDMVSEIRKHIHRFSPKCGEPYVGVVHRLDKPVSGVMVYAKEKKAAAALSKQVADGGMKKKYLAVICGKTVDNVENFVDYLLKDSKKNDSKIVDKGISGGKRAELICRFQTLRKIEPYGELTLAEIELLTGRHHQIRVQMAGHGLPIWGDNRYNPDFCALPGKPARFHGSIGLSACYLSFYHPVTGKQMEFYQQPSGGIFREFSGDNPH